MFQMQQTQLRGEPEVKRKEKISGSVPQVQRANAGWGLAYIMPGVQRVQQ